MKLQLMSMCIAERSHVQMRLRLHDEIVEELANRGSDYRAYPRDRMTSRLRRHFDEDIQYLFVLEDMDIDSMTRVRTHGHGMITLPRIESNTLTDGRTKAAYDRSVAKHGPSQAEFIWGRKMLREALQEIVGNREDRPSLVNGVDQTGNTWTRRSYNPLFNVEAISYAFKNVDASGSVLPANRIARSKNLVTEGRRFWDLVRLGEQALTEWADV